MLGIKELGSVAKRLDIVGHGTEEGIRIGEIKNAMQVYVHLRANQINFNDFEQIKLFVCSTGKGNFAQELANITRVEVIAPTKTILLEGKNVIVTDVRIGFSEIGRQRYDIAEFNGKEMIYTAEDFDFYQVYTRDSSSLGKWAHFKPN